MNANISFLTNVFSPALAGLFFLFFALFFFKVRQDVTSWRDINFPLYLLGFSVFLLSRPLQLFIGPHPWPLIGVCLRFALFCSLCSPWALLSALNITQKKRSLKWLIYATGSALAVIYITFSILGTTDSKVFFNLGELTAYDNNTPGGLGPWYGREVTLVIQILAGAVFYLLAAYLTLKEAYIRKQNKHSYRQLQAFGLGTLVFGMAFIIGSMYEQWWLYYFATVPSAALMGFALLNEAGAINTRVRRVGPFLREELFHTLSTGIHDESRLTELLDLLNKRQPPDTVVITAFNDSGVEGTSLMDNHDSLEKQLVKTLNETLSEDNYLMLPIGTGRFAICLASVTITNLHGLMKHLHTTLSLTAPCPLFIGTGRSYPVNELQQSYLEALSSLRLSIETNEPIIHFQGIHDARLSSRYPITERDEFLTDLRIGNSQSASRRLAIFLERLEAFSQNEASTLRARLNEVMGLVLAEIADLGQDSSHTYDLSQMAFDEMAHLKTCRELEEFFKKVIQKAMTRISVDTSAGIPPPTLRAQAYIAANYTSEITLKKVARAVGVSASHLQRLLRDDETSFSKLLTSARLSKSRELLLLTSDSISEIALEVGFNDSNYFSTVFKRNEGMTPRQFRKENQQ